jgi:hypothetical protein
MFVRFRETKTRLQLSLVETRRNGGKVCHEHIASLGSIETPPSVAARIEFWRRLHDRLGKLGNRVDPATQAKMLGDVHARVPMVTPEEQRALQLDNAKADADRWSSIHGMQVATVEDQKGLAATVADAITHGEVNAAEAQAKAKAAHERVERIERGENVEGGLGNPATREDFEAALIKAGFTREELRHCERVSTLHDVAQRIAGEAGWKEAKLEILDGAERGRKAATRRLLAEWMALAEALEDRTAPPDDAPTL